MESLECVQEIAKPELPEKKVKEKEQGQAQSKSLSFNLLELLREPQAYVEKIHELNERGVQKIRQPGGEGCEQAVKFLSKAEQMVNIGKSVVKVMDSDIRICVAYNLACAYQGLWILQKCKKSCEQATEQIEYSLSALGPEAKQLRVKLFLFLVKLKLQHCAILSQLGHHQKALEISKHGLKVLQESLQLILEFASSLQQKSRETVSGDKVIFTSTAQKFILMLKSLVETLAEDIGASRGKKPILYFWKNNPQNNQRLIKQQFANKRIFTRDEQQRSPLGLQHQNDWIEDFNIGTIMHMSAITYSEFHRIPSFFQQLTKKSLYQKVISCSVVYFTIATQIRFVEDPNKSKDSKKLPEPRSEAYRTSELYHLKAIEIMCKGISICSPYVNHLISSYYKHYLHGLNEIEENDNSQMEERSSRKSSVQASKDQMVGNQLVHEDYYYYNHSEQLSTMDKPSMTLQPPESELPSLSPSPQTPLPNSNFTEMLSDNLFPAEDSDQAPLRPATIQLRRSRKLLRGELTKHPRLARHQKSEMSLQSQKFQTSRSRTKAKELGRSSKCRTPESTQQSNKDINLLRKECNSKTKIPLSIIKRAFQDHGIKGVSPRVVRLTQKTSTEINVILKKRK